MDLINFRLRHHPDVRWRALGRQVVVLHQASGTYYTLNELGGFLWKSLEGGRRLGEIVEAVMERYDIDEHTARSDLLDVTLDLIEEGLVEAAEMTNER